LVELRIGFGGYSTQFPPDVLTLLMEEKHGWRGVVLWHLVAFFFTITLLAEHSGSLFPSITHGTSNC
jgi:hypothetical protein